MKTALIAFVAASAAFAALAAEKPAAPAAAPDAAKPRLTGRARMEMMKMRSFGGYVTDTRNQKGSVVVVNAQTAADKAWFDPLYKELNKLVKLRFETKDGAFDLANPVLKGEACVFVVDDPKLPMSLLASEAKWAMVNVAPLREGQGSKPQFFKARVQKSLMRQLASLMGAANSQYAGNLTGCVTKPSDFDLFTDFRLPVDTLGKFEGYVAGYGITPYAVVPYRKAVQEGWGPQPTNEFQKAIWEQVHKLPEAPLPLVKPTK